MAEKATIYKVQLQIANMDSHYYADHALTIACHPSETEERLMIRLLAFMLNASERLDFANGISDPDEPDLWLKDFGGEIDLWIQVGQPDVRTLAKACNRARSVVVYPYRQQPLQWWEAAKGKLARYDNLSVWLVDGRSVGGLASLARRTMNLLATIQDGDLIVRNDDDTVAVVLTRLK